MVDRISRYPVIKFATIATIRNHLLLMPIKFWNSANFGKLWMGQTISSLGSEVTAFALPLVAVLTLQATPFQMGVLNAAQFIPFLLVELFAGVWVDRLPRRPILIGADLGRAVLLGSIPLLVLLNQLKIEFLYVIAFCVGMLTLFFDVAYHSFLPLIVDREALMEGNSKPQIACGITCIITAGA